MRREARCPIFVLGIHRMFDNLCREVLYSVDF
jgi:hypothetical protein